MNAFEWFRVGVRLLALWALLECLKYFLFFADVKMELSPSASITGERNGSGFLLYAIGYGLAGLLLLKRADTVVAFSFGEGVDPNESESENMP